MRGCVATYEYQVDDAQTDEDDAGELVKESDTFKGSQNLFNLYGATGLTSERA